MTPMERHLGAWVFTAFLALYVLSTHGHVRGMGYEAEPYATAKQLVEHRDVSLFGSEIGGNPKAYGRNDLAQPLLMVPIYLVARLLPHGRVFSEEWVVALFTPFVSAILVWLIYRFGLDLSGSRRTAVLIAVLAGAGTMLWPYAVIGMEPVQTLLTLASAWLTYRFRRLGSPMYLVGAGLAIAFLFQAKRASPILLPPLLLYLGYVVLERRGNKRVPTIAAVALLVSFLMTSIGVSMWIHSIKGPGAGLATQLANLRENGWLPGGLYGFLFSAGKSFFVYNPPALLGLLALPAFYRRHRVEALLFGTLVLIPYVFFSMFAWWADETWGPRYLHVTVPFLLLCLTAIDWPQVWSRRQRIAVTLTLALGVAVQILGLLFWYGRYFNVLTAAKLNTLASIQFDPRLSNLWINLLLAWSVVSQNVLGRPVFLDYTPPYWFTAPPDYSMVAQPRHIDLQPFARIEMWFPATLMNPAVSMPDRFWIAALALLLLALLAAASTQIWRVCRLEHDAVTSAGGQRRIDSDESPSTV